MEFKDKLEDKYYLHWLNLMPEFGPKRLWKLKRYFGSFEAATKAREVEVDLERKVAAEAAKLEKLGVEIIDYDDDQFPAQLRELATPPLLLYYRGSLSKINTKFCIGVVGSRRPSAYGIKVTEKIVGELTAAGIIVVSGLAFGIDITAHRSSLKNNGTTVAVVPSGVDELSIYPQSHSRIANTITERGCIISECPPGSSTLPYCFLARNRIIAGLCRGVVIVECAEKSGALMTARYARDENRVVYAVPGSIFNPMSRGPNMLLGQGAIPIDSAEDIFKDLNLFKEEGSKSAEAEEIKYTNLTEKEKLVLQYINSLPQAVDTIIKSASEAGQLSQAEVITALATLELNGLIMACGPEQYSLIN